MTARARGFVAALGLFTICPVPARCAGAPPARVVRWMPLIGVLLGGAAMIPALAVWRGGDHGSPLLAAALVVATLAALTRGLHLDGLADLADGLGSRRPGPEALAVMRQSDIGPFGVVAVVLSLVVQISAVAAVFAATSRPEGLVAVVVVATTGRVAVLQAAGTGLPSARSGGFGAVVAGSVGPVARVGTAGVLAVAAALAQLFAGGSVAEMSWAGAAAVLGLGSAALVRRHVVRRLGGVTGDVFGALLEFASTVTAVVLAAGVAWG